MNRLSCSAMLAVAIIAACGLTPVGAQAPASKPQFTVETVTGTGVTRTAVLNLVRIFDARDGCEQIKDLNAILRQGREDSQKEAEARKKSLDEMKIKLSAYRPESPDYGPARDAYSRQNIEFNAWAQGKKEELDGEEFRWMARMYDLVSDATRRVAEERHIDLVMTVEPFDAAAVGDDLRALQAQIRARKVLYATPAADVTEAVIAKLNEDYKARGGRASLGGKPSPQAQPVVPSGGKK